MAMQPGSITPQQFGRTTAATVMQEMRVDEADVRRRLTFVGFGPEDQRRLAQVRDVVERGADDLANEFFAHLQGFDEAQTLFRDPPLLDAARRLKREHIVALVTGPYDAAYAGQRIELALTYSTVRLPVNLFLGAFHTMMRSMGERIMKSLPREPEKGFAAFMSVKKVAFFDLGLMTDVLIAERERIIRAQTETILELSTPVLQVWDQVLAVPLIGTLDSARTQRVMESLLEAIAAREARYVILDVSGVPTVDTAVAQHLMKTIQAARLMGARTLLSGVRPETAQAMVHLGISLEGLVTRYSLRDALRVALTSAEEERRGSAERGEAPDDRHAAAR
jgi:rsbT co-antagonist protein RsbR